MKRQLALGLDPSEERRQERASAEAQQGGRVRNLFEHVAREWLELRLLSWTPRYAALVEGRLEADIFPVIGPLDIARITPRQILEAIRKIEARGAIEMARRVENHCSEIFRYAIPDGRCETDPCRDLNPAMSKPRPVAHRAKVQARDLPGFFAKLNADKGERLSHLALRWTMLTMVRTQETRFAEWSEFEGLDGPEPIWRLSPERMKMRAEHFVLLSRQVLDVLDELRQLNVWHGSGPIRLGRFLFPVAHSKTLTISENRMLDIMYRIGLRGKATVHGFRGLASTVLNESGLFEPDWIEHQLAHQPQGVRAAYNAARYLVHRRPMMQWWGDLLDAAETKGMQRAARAFDPSADGRSLSAPPDTRPGRRATTARQRPSTRQSAA